MFTAENDPPNNRKNSMKIPMEASLHLPIRRPTEKFTNKTCRKKIDLKIPSCQPINLDEEISNTPTSEVKIESETLSENLMTESKSAVSLIKSESRISDYDIKFKSMFRSYATFYRNSPLKVKAKQTMPMKSFNFEKNLLGSKKTNIRGMKALLTNSKYNLSPMMRLSKKLNETRISINEFYKIRMKLEIGNKGKQPIRMVNIFKTPIRFGNEYKNVLKKGKPNDLIFHFT